MIYFKPELVESAKMIIKSKEDVDNIKRACAFTYN